MLKKMDNMITYKNDILSYDNERINFSFTVTKENGYLKCKIICDPPYNTSAEHLNFWWHPFARVSSDKNIIESVQSEIADNEMSRELCYFILERSKQSELVSEDVKRAIKFLLLFDRTTFEKDVDDVDISNPNLIVAEGIIYPPDDIYRDFNSTYFFYKTCINNGISITVKAKKSIGGNAVIIISNNDLGLPAGSIDEKMVEIDSRESNLGYHIICEPGCYSSKEIHPFYRIYDSEKSDFKLNCLKGTTNIVENNNLMISILRLICKPDIFLKEEIKTQKTIRYRAYLIEFLSWMWD